MKKLLPMTLCASLLVPTSAMALEIGAEFEVYVDDDFAGTIIPVMSRDAGSHCAYKTVWYNQLYRNSEECDLLERKTRTYPSCHRNKYINIPTSLTNDAYCAGWSGDGYPVEVEYLHAGENYYGLTGAVKFAGWFGFSSIEAWVP